MTIQNRLMYVIVSAIFELIKIHIFRGIYIFSRTAINIFHYTMNNFRTIYTII